MRCHPFPPLTAPSLRLCRSRQTRPPVLPCNARRLRAASRWGLNNQPAGRGPRFQCVGFRVIGVGSQSMPAAGAQGFTSGSLGISVVGVGPLKMF